MTVDADADAEEDATGASTPPSFEVLASSFLLRKRTSATTRRSATPPSTPSLSLSFRSTYFVVAVAYACFIVEVTAVFVAVNPSAQSPTVVKI